MGSVHVLVTVFPKIGMNFLIACTVCLFLGVQGLSSSKLAPSLAVTMICRDEAVNFKANLARWLTIADYFVFMIDTRSIDNSTDVVKAIIDQPGKFYKISPYNFTGFGEARTLSLHEAWEHFPQASHVLIADPDWSPNVDTMDIYDLDDSADVFRFTAFDRNGITKRRMDWLLRHREGLAMKYHLHEVLDIGMYSVKHLSWEVHEIEKPGTWHTTVGHSSSFAPARYHFDLDLLYKDLAAYGHDPHTHYYLGVTHEAYASKVRPLLGVQHAEVQYHAGLAAKYLELRATAHYTDEFPDQRWAVMLQLGIVHTTYKVL